LSLRLPTLDSLDQVIDLLSKSPYFRRHYGHDHFVLHAGNQGLGRMNNKPGCRQFLGFACENCTKLGLETLLAVSLHTSSSSFLSSSSSSSPPHFDKCGESPHWHAIPFPSNIHWNTNMTMVPWSDPTSSPRRYAVSFTGSLSSFSKRSR
jgi:hypothetical protein